MDCLLFAGEYPNHLIDLFVAKTAFLQEEPGSFRIAEGFEIFPRLHLEHDLHDRIEGGFDRSRR